MLTHVQNLAGPINLSYNLNMKTEKSAGIILYRLEQGQPKVLVLHYTAGHWDFPKGKLEPGETDVQAALREVQEETGITHLELQPSWKQTLHYIYTRAGERISKTVVFFLGLTRQSQIKLSHEHQGSTWLSPPEAEKRLTFDNAKKILRLATPIWKK